ncbi:hypothetical protein [Jatrophihabitans endophyticus]|uniref:hypothetical protein n=1 Tax=Jatrophihabitans endophyticus TaxID=1206085 RepID=UPI001A030D73|nr:hypothetical protein [Jatrophihabitans endophyticus]MBE7186737.1 hypothetical protein [Jatrophihabitans endophyticus]
MQRYRLKNNALDFPQQSSPDWDRVATAMSGPALSVGQARRAPVGSTVRIQAVARPGEAGPLTAPLSGKPCVWYRCYVQFGSTGYRPQPLPEAGRVSDIMLVAAPATGPFARHDNGDEISEAPFEVVGEDGSAITVDPRVATVSSGGLTRNRVEGSRFGFASQLLVEWIVPVDAPVTVLGTVAPGMQLGSARSDFLFVSTRSEQHIVDRARHGLGEHSSAAQFRFVAHATRFSRRVKTGTRVFLVAGVLVLVIAVLLAIVL